MGRKKKAPEAEPAEASQTATATPATAEGDKVNKSEEARKEWHSGNKDVNAIVQALKARGIEVTYQGVYQAVKSLSGKKRTTTNKGQETHGKGQEGHGKEPSLSDLRAVAKLAAELGGLDRLSTCVEAIKDISAGK